ncbi:putative Amino acid/amide ABC transporter substrate-binding protein (HAAT family) [Frankia sp. Hr75.2]|nr:putative Amino acid/amide ABC transporter substrate-binding protein (HAAT family) [Frankia sp. Hr75.2]
MRSVAPRGKRTVAHSWVRRGTCLLTVTSTLVLAASCGSADSGSGGGSEIKIGAVSDVTGSNPYPEATAAAKAVFDAVNQDGGINGHRIDYTVYDAANSSATAAQAALKLITQDQVVAMAGAGSAVDCSANRELYAENKIYSITAYAADTECFNSPNITPLNMGGPLGGQIALYYLANVVHSKKVCFTLYQIPNQMEAQENALEEGMKYANFNNVEKIILKPGSTDYTPVVIAVKNAGCDAFIFGASPSSTAALIRAADTQGVFDGIRWLALSNSYGSESASLLKDPKYNGIQVNTELEPYLADSSTVAPYQALMKEYNVPLTAASEAGYVSAQLLVSILKKMSGPYTREAVGEAMRSASQVSTGGFTAEPFTWGKFNKSSKFLTLNAGAWELKDEKWYTLPN